MPTFHRIEIAKAHCHRAIVLFVEEEDFINAITLAGAAEEVLGRFVARSKLTPAMHELTEILYEELGGKLDRKVIRDDHLNRARNTLKHFNEGNEEIVEIEPEEEAMAMIFRAINNLLLVEGELSEHAKIFIGHVKKKRPDVFDGMDLPAFENF